MRFLSHAFILVFLAATASIAAFLVFGGSVGPHGSLGQAVAYRIPFNTGGAEPSARRVTTALDVDRGAIACRAERLPGLVLLKCGPADRAHGTREIEHTGS